MLRSAVVFVLLHFLNFSLAQRIAAVGSRLTFIVFVVVCVGIRAICGRFFSSIMYRGGVLLPYNLICYGNKKGNVYQVS